MASCGCGNSGLRSVAAAVFLLCLLTTGANGWGIVQFHGSRNCSSDRVSFARLCTANKCCSAISYSPADQSQSAIGAKGQCANGRVVGKLYAAYGSPRVLYPRPPIVDLPCVDSWCVQIAPARLCPHSTWKS